MSWFSFRPNLLLNTLHEVFDSPIAEPPHNFCSFWSHQDRFFDTFHDAIETFRWSLSMAVNPSMYFYIPFRPNKLFETDFISFNAYCHSRFLRRYVVFIRFSPDYEMYIIFQKSKDFVQSALKSAVFRTFWAVIYCSYYNQAASLTGWKTLLPLKEMQL